MIAWFQRFDGDAIAGRQRGQQLLALDRGRRVVALVAGFDVFGNLAHQVNVRRYMDYLRMEGELNFVHFLPPEIRAPFHRALGKLKQHVEQFDEAAKHFEKALEVAGETAVAVGAITTAATSPRIIRKRD